MVKGGGEQSKINKCSGGGAWTMELEIITDRQTDHQTDMRDHRKVSAVILDERSVRNLKIDNLFEVKFA